VNVGTVSNGITTFTDTGLTDSTTYYYVVGASDGPNESGNSNEAFAAPLDDGAPNPPINLTAVDRPGDTGGAINLAWIPSTSPGVTTQEIYRSTTSGGGYAILTTLNDSTSSAFTDSTATNGVPYYYVAKALKSGVASLNSNPASATAIDNSGAGGRPTARSLAFPVFLRHPISPIYQQRYTITLEGSSPLPLTFQIVVRPTYNDSDMSMTAGTEYQWWDGAGWRPECGFSPPDTCRATTSTIVSTDGLVTPQPAGSPPTVIYHSKSCVDFPPGAVDQFQYVAIDSANNRSEPATVTLTNDPTDLCPNH
jgi:hypothetical protein